jgi:segregation and condensation protein B
MELKIILEAILFSSQKPLTPHELRAIITTAAEQSSDQPVRAFKNLAPETIVAALEELRHEHEQARRSYRLACVASAWQFVSQPEFAPWLKVLQGQKARPPRLTQPALETLAIIAYRQPVTRAEVEQVRGVTVDGVMQTLLERALVEQTGRAEVAGRPALYATTSLFLEYFGLRSLDDLPVADELRRVVMQKSAELLTVEPGLATAPPDQLTQTDNTRATTASGPDHKTQTGQNGSSHEPPAQASDEVTNPA